MSIDKEKLMRFEETVFNEAQQQIEQMNRELEQYKHSELDKTRQNEYDRLYAYMQDQVHKLQWRYKQSVTKAQLDAKREVLKFRTALSESVFNAAKSCLVDFAETDAYEQFLIDQIRETAKICPLEQSVLFLQKDDIKYTNEIQDALGHGFEIQPDKKIHLGGFKLQNNELGIVIDETFESNLADQHQYFYETCGLNAAE